LLYWLLFSLSSERKKLPEIGGAIGKDQKFQEATREPDEIDVTPKTRKSIPNKRRLRVANPTGYSQHPELEGNIVVGQGFGTEVRRRRFRTCGTGFLALPL
jgi:hypothetical protein